MLIIIINTSSLNLLSIHHFSVSQHPLFEEVQQPMDVRQRSSLYPQNYQAASGDSELRVKYIGLIFSSLCFKSKEEFPESMNEKY